MTSQNLKLLHLFETLQQGLFDLIFRDEVRHVGLDLWFGPVLHHSRWELDVEVLNSELARN
jgi:hypothetical protein